MFCRGASGLLLCLFCSLFVYRVNSFHSRKTKPVISVGRVSHTENRSRATNATRTGSDPFCLVSKDKFRKGCENVVSAHKQGGQCTQLAREYLACRGKACKAEREEVLACIQIYRKRKDWMTTGRNVKCQPALKDYNACRKKLAFKEVVLPGPRKIVPPARKNLDIDTKSVEGNKNKLFSVTHWLKVAREYDQKLIDDHSEALRIHQKLTIDKSPSHKDIPRMITPHLNATKIKNDGFSHQGIAQKLRATASKADLRVRHALAIFGNHSRRRFEMYGGSDASIMEKVKALKGCCNKSDEGEEEVHWIQLNNVDAENKSLWWNPKTDTTSEETVPKEPEDKDTPNSVAHFTPDPRHNKEITLPAINYQIDPEDLQAEKAKKDFAKRLSKYDSK